MAFAQALLSGRIAFVPVRLTDGDGKDMKMRGHSRTAAPPDRLPLHPAGYPGSGRGWRLRSPCRPRSLIGSAAGGKLVMPRRRPGAYKREFFHHRASISFLWAFPVRHEQATLSACPQNGKAASILQSPAQAAAVLCRPDSAPYPTSISRAVFAASSCSCGNGLPTSAFAAACWL